ncbi:CGNR zinc finger domain-containing protein [Agromyces salentinus]|uniref:CGNR zinc finger domain-containing protein n=1 Tax=Agromyces salentinus TaxID=269421 RepID=A0ABN2MGP7_9MICO|nr:CGNR zinc finger domain-containing protein [Agromyces salentinus]
MSRTVYPSAPGELEFVRSFVNTLDVEKGTDQLRDGTSWMAWATEHQVRGAASAADLAVAREVREAIREAMIANHDRSGLPAGAISALDMIADRANVKVRFSATGARLRGSGAGIDAAFARIVTAVAESIADDTWTRLKACVNDECQWAFYDTSRSRTGQWCSMSICGNRAKQSRWRAARDGS